MGIVNRRNAVMGWAVWQVGKRVARQKAKSAVPTVDTEKKRPNKTAIAAGIAAVAGLLLLWRKKGNEQPAEPEAEQRVEPETAPEPEQPPEPEPPPE
jgi:hypothetical protein